MRMVDPGHPLESSQPPALCRIDWWPMSPSQVVWTSLKSKVVNILAKVSGLMHFFFPLFCITTGCSIQHSKVQENVTMVGRKRGISTPLTVVPNRTTYNVQCPVAIFCGTSVQLSIGCRSGIQNWCVHLHVVWTTPGTVYMHTWCRMWDLAGAKLDLSIPLEWFKECARYVVFILATEDTSLYRMLSTSGLKWESYRKITPTVHVSRNKVQTYWVGGIPDHRLILVDRSTSCPTWVPAEIDCGFNAFRVEVDDEIKDAA